MRSATDSCDAAAPRFGPPPPFSVVLVLVAIVVAVPSVVIAIDRRLKIRARPGCERHTSRSARPSNRSEASDHGGTRHKVERLRAGLR
jgi:hypothetical protein